MPMTLRFELFPRDVGHSADFYSRVLGFSVDRDERDADQPYASLSRDGVQIGLAQREDVIELEARRPPTGVELVLEVDDLDAERSRVEAAEWPVEAEVQPQPWGLRDFRVLDPDGYYLRLTSREA